MLISVPVLSDRLKFKQTLPWAPLPNSCQSNTTINKGIFPTSLQPWRFSPSFFLLSSYSPWQSIQHISNRRCLNLQFPYIIVFIELALIPATHPTRSCIRSFDSSVRFASRAISKQCIDAAHPPTLHPPTLSLLFLRDTVTFVRSAAVPEKLYSACSKEYPLCLRTQVRHSHLG